MSKNKSRVGALVETIREGNVERLLNVRSAWADTGEIATTRIVVFGVNRGNFQIQEQKGSRGFEITLSNSEKLDLSLKKNRRRVRNVRGVDFFIDHVVKTVGNLKKYRENNDGSIVLTFRNESSAEKSVALLNGREFVFSIGKLRAYQSQSKIHSGDIDFGKAKNRVHSGKDEGYTVRYIIGNSKSSDSEFFDTSENGDIFIALRQHSRRDRLNPVKESWQGDRDFWTIVALYADGSVESESGDFADTNQVNRHLEMLVGKKRKLTNYSEEKYVYDLEVSDGDRGVNVALANEMLQRTEYRFNRASNAPQDRSSLKGWDSRPGQDAPKAKGTVNTQLAVELTAIKNGLLPPDTRHVGMLYGTQIVSRFVEKRAKEPEKGRKTVDILDRESLRRRAADLRVEAMVTASQKPTIENKKELPSATSAPKEKAGTLPNPIAGEVITVAKPRSETSKQKKDPLAVPESFFDMLARELG